MRFSQQNDNGVTDFSKGGRTLTSCDDVLRHLARAEGYCLLIILLRRRRSGQRGRRDSRVRSWGVVKALLKEAHKHEYYSQLSSIAMKVFFFHIKENCIIKETKNINLKSTAII